MPVFDPGYCEDEAMAFSLPGNVFDIEWNFNDPASGINNTANGSSVFHTYANPAVYSIFVSASDIHGCISDTSNTAEIHVNEMSGLITISPAGKMSSLQIQLGHLHICQCVQNWPQPARCHE